MSPINPLKDFKLVGKGQLSIKINFDRVDFNSIYENQMAKIAYFWASKIALRSFNK